jgi:hypothetical protein
MREKWKKKRSRRLRRKRRKMRARSSAQYSFFVPIFYNTNFLLYRVIAQLVASLAQGCQNPLPQRRFGPVQSQKPLEPLHPRLAWCCAFPCSLEMHVLRLFSLLCWSFLPVRQNVITIRIRIANIHAFLTKILFCLRERKLKALSIHKLTLQCP